jgi:hypothetical protein
MLADERIISRSLVSMLVSSSWTAVEARGRRPTRCRLDLTGGGEIFKMLM